MFQYVLRSLSTPANLGSSGCCSRTKMSNVLSWIFPELGQHWKASRTKVWSVTVDSKDSPLIVTNRLDHVFMLMHRARQAAVFHLKAFTPLWYCIQTQFHRCKNLIQIREYEEPNLATFILLFLPLEISFRLYAIEERWWNLKGGIRRTHRQYGGLKCLHFSHCFFIKGNKLVSEVILLCVCMCVN